MSSLVVQSLSALGGGLIGSLVVAPWILERPDRRARRRGRVCAWGWRHGDYSIRLVNGERYDINAPGDLAVGYHHVRDQYTVTHRFTA